MSFLVSIFKPLAYISLPIILVRSIATSSPVGRYYTRMVVYVGALITVGSCGIVIAAGMSLIGRSTDANNVVARIFYATVGRALDLKVEVEGEKHLNTSPAVFMVNHQSILDVLVIGRLMPKQTAIMAKKSLQFSPIGPFMSMSGTIFIDRGNNAKAIRSIDVAGKHMMSTKTSLWMFPEGTRFLSKEPDMLSLKKGGFHLALNAGIPIIPIVIENYWHLYRPGVFESGIIKVRVLRPIPTVDLSSADVGTLATSVRKQMLDTLHDFYAKSDLEQPENLHQEKGASGPTESPTMTTTLSPSIGIEALETIPDITGSSSSLASSLASSHQRTLDANETGGETEEDDGMILVGRPIKIGT
jgi:lysophosphatidate acyltransferase